jgi:hypothetical protein
MVIKMLEWLIPVIVTVFLVSIGFVLFGIAASMIVSQKPMLSKEQERWFKIADACAAIVAFLSATLVILVLSFALSAVLGVS